MYLIESGGRVIDELKKIVKSRVTTKVTFQNGESFNVSATNADKILETYRELNSSNRVKFIIMVNTNVAGFNKALAFSVQGK